MELFGIKIDAAIVLQATSAVSGVLVIWRGLKVRKVIQNLTSLVSTVSDARSASSPGGPRFTRAEMEEVIEAASNTAKALSPLFARLFSK